MSVEWFLKLKEIDSLTKMKAALAKAKHDQNARIAKLQERRQDNLSQTALLKQSIITTNSEMAEVEKKLLNASEQKQRLLDVGADEKKILQYQQEIAILEDAGLELLNRLEKIESEISENKTFLKGLENTIHEIEEEGRSEEEKINLEISNIDLRIGLLFEELPADFKSLLLKITAKNLAHGPFTRIDQGSCFFCRFKISRIDESEIDMQKNLKTCNQCGRIFLPFGV